MAGHDEDGPNVWGTVGLVLSALGVVTCGLLFPVGFVVSLVGLSRPPRRQAALGAAVGGLGMVAIAAGLAAFVFAGYRSVQAQQSAWIDQANEWALAGCAMDVEAHRSSKGALPTDAEGNAIAGAHVDGWGHALRYERVGDAEYRLTIAGADRLFNTADDVVKLGGELAAALEPAGSGGESDVDLIRDAYGVGGQP